MVESPLRVGLLFLHTARPGDAQRLARYHTVHATHLSRFDLGWSTEKGDMTSQLQYLATLQPTPSAQGQRSHWQGWLGRDRIPMGDVLGLVDLEWAEPPPNAAVMVTLGYSLSPDLEGRGAMTQTLEVLLSTWRPYDGCTNTRIQAHVRRDHGRSRRMLTRLGFVDCGPDPDFPTVLADGLWQPHHRYILDLADARATSA